MPEGAHARNAPLLSSPATAGPPRRVTGGATLRYQGVTTRIPRPAGHRGQPSPAPRPFSRPFSSSRPPAVSPVPPFTGPGAPWAKSLSPEHLHPPAHAGDTGGRAGESPAPDAESTARATAAAAALIRWGAFAGALVPVTLVVCGAAVTTALGAAAGLTLLTAASGALLHRSQQLYAQQGSGLSDDGGPGPHRGRHGRTGTGLHRGGRPW